MTIFLKKNVFLRHFGIWTGVKCRREDLWVKLQTNLQIIIRKSPINAQQTQQQNDAILQFTMFFLQLVYLITLEVMCRINQTLKQHVYYVLNMHWHPNQPTTCDKHLPSCRTFTEHRHYSVTVATDWSRWHCSTARANFHAPASRKSLTRWGKVGNVNCWTLHPPTGNIV